MSEDDTDTDSTDSRQSRLHWLVDNSAPVQHRAEYRERTSRMVREVFGTVMDSMYSHGDEEMFPILWEAVDGLEPDAVAWAEPFEESDTPTPAIARVYVGIGTDDEMAIVATSNAFDEQSFYVGLRCDAVRGFVELRSDRMFESTSDDWVDEFACRRFDKDG